jgi:hypothetical protein
MSDNTHICSLLAHVSKTLNQCLGDFWAYSIGQDPNVSKCNRLHVVILWLVFMNLRYISYILLKGSVIFLKS